MSLTLGRHNGQTGHGMPWPLFPDLRLFGNAALARAATAQNACCALAMLLLTFGQRLVDEGLGNRPASAHYARSVQVDHSSAARQAPPGSVCCQPLHHASRQRILR